MRARARVTLPYIQKKNETTKDIVLKYIEVNITSSATIV